MSKHNINIIMPMGGLGSRFRSTVPKPFIKVGNQRLYEYSLQSLYELTAYNNVNLTIIYRWDENYNEALVALNEIKLYNCFDNINIKIINDFTSGPVATCSWGEKYIDDDEVIIVLDCDLSFYSKEFLNEITRIANDESYYDGCLLTFESFNPAYSYVKSKNNIAIELKEKDVISNNAIAGAYCFSSGKAFKQYVDKIRTDFCFDLGETHKETYMSWLVDDMIKDGAKFFITNVDYYYSLGTPDEVSNYLKNRYKELYITDLDGTLCDTKEANYLSYQKVFKEMFGVNLKIETYDECFGLRIDDFLKKLNIDLYYKDEIKKRKAEEYKNHINDIELNTTLFSDLIEAKQKGNIIALATTASKENVEFLLKKLCIYSIFDIIMTGEDVVKPKPDPEIYTTIMRKANVLPAYTYIYEDSETGIQAAINAKAAGVIHANDIYDKDDFKKLLK